MFNPEFDCVFTVEEDDEIGGFTAYESDAYYAPEFVVFDGEDDLSIDGWARFEHPNWTPLVGYTSQYGYHGAVMHASEQFDGTLAADVLSTPGTYVLVVVNVECDDDCEDDCDDTSHEPAGWAVLERR